MKDYINSIKTIEKKDKYDKSDLFRSDLLYSKSGNIDVYYAPFDYVNRKARVVLLGITPGWTQMNNAYVDFIHNLDHLSLEECYQRIKKVASFSGTLRIHLVNMLDEIHLNQYLNIESCSLLFSEANHLVHNASILRYPVFVKSDNYTGSTPNMLRTDILKNMILDLFVPEFKLLDDDVLIIPMGKAVSEGLEYLKVNNLMKQDNILFHFPHPSGANGSRIKQFQTNKATFIEVIKRLK